MLDVGAGVGELSAAFARKWPKLQVVAIEPANTPYQQALQNIANLDFCSRIEIRQIKAEDLADIGTYDLIWLPQVFIPEDAIRAVHHRLLRALKPGGWLWVITVSTNGTKLERAAMSLRTHAMGGVSLTVNETTDLLNSAGYCPICHVPNQDFGEYEFVVAQRPEGEVL